MNLCDDNHMEVCYEGRRCPVCALIEDHKAEVGDLNDQINDAKKIIGDLEADLERLTEPLRSACLDALRGGDAT